MALNGTLARQETLQSKQSQPGFDFTFVISQRKKFPKQVAHIQMGGLF